MVDKNNPLPLYIQLREEVRSHIETGAFPPGYRLPLELELANQYGVSSVTVKHALRDLAKEGLIDRIKRKGTFVSPRGLASRLHAKTFAFVIPEIEDLFICEIYRGVVAATQQAGYKVSVLSSDRNVVMEAENIRDLGRHGEEGAIILPNWGRANAEQIFDLKKRKFPFVLVNRYFRDIQTDHVVVDNIYGACQAVEHLIRLGHRRIGCISWVECTAVEDRLAGYRKALGRHRIPYDEKLVRSIMDNAANKYVGLEPASGGYHEMKRLLQSKQRPTAVFAVSDRLAVGAMKAIREAGLEIPDDIAVVGFDDLRYAADLDLTTVAQPAFLTGEKAAQILMERKSQPVGDASEYKRIVLPTTLIVRGSCGGRNQADELQEASSWRFGRGTCLEANSKPSVRRS